MALLETPVDQRSGLPLLIAPDVGGLVPRVMSGEVSNKGPEGPVINTNHVFSPWRALTRSGPGGVALHNARGQELLVEDHVAYTNLCSGPPLPGTDEDRAALAVLCLANYIPEEALCVGDGRLEVIRLAAAERDRLRTSGEVHVIDPSQVYAFLRQHLLTQPIKGIPPAKIDRFLRLDPSVPDDAAEQVKLADFFLSYLIRPVVAPIEGAYRYGYDRNLLAPDAPPQPEPVVKGLVFSGRKRVRGMVQELTKNLAARRTGRTARRLGNLVTT